jgi:hypothetical protein
VTLPENVLMAPTEFLVEVNPCLPPDWYSVREKGAGSPLSYLFGMSEDDFSHLLETAGHQGLDSWDQNDSFLNLNDHASKRPIFYIGSKISHKFADLVLICESRSNQRRPNLTWDLNFAFKAKFKMGSQFCFY